MRGRNKERAGQQQSASTANETALDQMTWNLSSLHGRAKHGLDRESEDKM